MLQSIPTGAAPMQGRTFSLTFPSELRMLSVARNFVDAICDAYRLDRTMTHALVIVTGEAVTNIVRHAHQNRPDSQIEMHLHLLPDSAELTFIDQGAPFDLEAVPELPPGELRIGGRGVYLMRTLMDELTCAPRPSDGGGNILRMVKRYTQTDMRDCG
ncbi:MAG TPA: ATP-binding protein [Gemmataceae bacterium]|nr:ATP-binding protein [Gemmataceae bacterium]